MKKFVLSISLLMMISTTPGARAEDVEISKLFRDKNLSGCITISSLDGKTTYTHNDERSKTRLCPASTFKILNTLIALDEKAVGNEKEIIKWDGEDKGLQLWNRDQSMETAFPLSCVWFYQELAKRVGTAAYERYLRKIGYGNATPGGDLTNFWLNGELKISAVEQLDFLRKVYQRKLPFSSSAYEVLAKLMIVEQSHNWTIRAKTGWAQRLTPQIGWYVGYIETGNGVWIFAMNIDINRPEDRSFREKITYAALTLKGIMSDAAKRAEPQQ